MYWEAYAQTQPIGPWAADFRAGQICAVIANVNSKKGGWKPWSFFPWLRPVNETDPDLIEQQLAGLAGVMI